MSPVRIAVVGCGFVADLYMQTLELHPELKLVGAADRDSDRAKRFCEYHSVPMYRSLEEILGDKDVEIVLNLTNPRSHFSISKACLAARKHVYSEKPLTTSLSEARELVALANRQGVYLSSAPSRVLGETAQTMWKALRDGVVGPVRLAYAELDDGPIHRMPYWKWRSASGAPWPYDDEFETGCTLEHAGYAVSWLAAFFGPAETVSAYAACLMPEKGAAVRESVQTPDFSVASIKFASGPVARLTCSVFAPRDHSIRIFGDDGILSTDDCWRARCPVHVRRYVTIRRRTIATPWRRRLPLAEAQFRRRSKRLRKVDFCLGVMELASAIKEGRPCRLSAEYCLHVTEIVLAIQESISSRAGVRVRSSFDAMAPMPWAT